MKHGFKAKAEKMAAAARSELGLPEIAALCPFKYAEHLGVLVLDFRTLDLPDEHKERLTKHDPESWSGLTLQTANVHAIVVNPSHSEARKNSTLAHELAHYLLKHQPANVHMSDAGLLLLSDYDTEQEEEADWLGAALLLPRSALLVYRRKGATVEDRCGF